MKIILIDPKSNFISFIRSFNGIKSNFSFDLKYFMKKDVEFKFWYRKK
jgi:hypothetical protein